MKLKRIAGLQTLAITAALAWITAAPAFSARTIAHARTPSTISPGGPVLGGEAKRILREELAQQEHRKASYRSWFYRKYGDNPTLAQFHDWHFRSYGAYPQ